MNTSDGLQAQKTEKPKRIMVWDMILTHFLTIGMSEKPFNQKYYFFYTHNNIHKGCAEVAETSKL
ncbi:CLUMA_CG009591, isoform A [Clunio marinus]|uniref:CLUMA_CG009591, isoform A n=1 Tax=Clunio marinus TaxID=568069 RepID=A0A1J1I8W7_9DIPT|nr:CLUMA_CG009591, isoform A [Clunio marinus]